MENNEPVFKKVRSDGLVISRVPKYIRDAFLALSEEEFADDYGMCLSQVFKEAMEYRQLKNMFYNNQLNIKLGFDEIKDKEEQEEFVEKKLRMMDGSTKTKQEVKNT